MTEGLSAADVALLQGGNGRNDGGWGDNGSWWIILFLIFAIFGWNNAGYGGAGNGSRGVQDAYVLTSDFSQLSRQISDSTAMTERKLDGVNNGLCSGFYQEAQLINGVNMQNATNTAALQQALTTQGFETRNAITQDTISNMQGFNTVNAAIKDCCCQTQQNLKDVSYNVATQANMIGRQVERGFADANYNLATQANGIQNTIQSGFCQTNFNAQTNTRDIVDSQNAGTRAILDKLSQMEANAKDEKIAELTAKNFDLRLAASQEAQNRLLINELGYQCPKPAYVVQPPQQVAFATNCGGVATFANNGCGCGCGVTVQ